MNIFAYDIMDFKRDLSCKFSLALPVYTAELKLWHRRPLSVRQLGFVSDMVVCSKKWLRAARPNCGKIPIDGVAAISRRLYSLRLPSFISYGVYANIM